MVRQNRGVHGLLSFKVTARPENDPCDEGRCSQASCNEPMGPAA